MYWKIYEILTIFMAKKLCLWYTVSDKRTAPLFLRAAYKYKRSSTQCQHYEHRGGKQYAGTSKRGLQKRDTEFSLCDYALT